MNVDAKELLTIIASGGIGWLIAIVTFRTRIALIEKTVTDLQTQATKFANAIEKVERAFNSIERRQLVQLQLSAQIAHKLGINNRLPEDMLVKLLGEDDDFNGTT